MSKEQKVSAEISSELETFLAPLLRQLHAVMDKRLGKVVLMRQPRATLAQLPPRGFISGSNPRLLKRLASFWKQSLW